MTQKATETRTGSRAIWIWGIVAVLFIVGAWLLTFLILKDWNKDLRGTFGDMFGSVNALFSGLALAGIIFTILLQRKDLQYQREELEATRREFIIQNETLRMQRFENTFFNLLSLHHQIVEGIDDEIEKSAVQKTMDHLQGISERKIIKLQGRDVFKYRYDKLRGELNHTSNTNYEETYLEHYNAINADFGHYFRNLYRILKFVHETEFHAQGENKMADEFGNEEIKNESFEKNYLARYRYTSMVRAQLSDYELLWLFYNCLSENGIEKFKPLVEEYTLFKNLPQGELHERKLKEKFDTQAFEKKPVVVLSLRT